MAGDVSKYLALVASQFCQQPKYMAMLSVVLQAFADATAVAQSLPQEFDLDGAVGSQLDIDGLWIGNTRVLREPIDSIYFAWDTSGLGWDQGVWYQTGDPTDNILTLPDQQFRLLLKATAAANEWDGTIPGAYADYTLVFGALGYNIAITDNQDMTMELTLFGGTPDVLTQAMYEGGYLNLRPAGVEITAYNVFTHLIFAMDSPGAGFGGFDTGYFFT